MAGDRSGYQTNRQTLQADIADWVRESEQRMLDVVVASLQDVTRQAQTTKDKGGKMPYDTGFLSWTGRASKDGWPSGPDEQPANATKGQFTWNGEAVTAVLIDLKFGETFYFGWTAVYANQQNLYNGFLDAAVQNWQSIVDKNVERLRSRSRGS